MNEASDAAWSKKIAGLVIDALVTARILPLAEVERATKIAAEEIYVRLALRDRP